jgi:hypothetical protein
MQLNWPVTPWNSLNLSVAGGYNFYAQNSDLNQFFLNPGTGLAFELFIGDWMFTVSDQMKMQESALENPTRAGGSDSSSLENDAGVAALWDLGKLQVNAGYNHVDYVTLSGVGSGRSPASENFTVNVGATVVPELQVGVAGGATLAEGQTATATPNAFQWQAGLFAQMLASEHFTARLDAGYSIYTPEQSSTNSLGASAAVYFQLSVTHQVNAHVRYKLAAGHSIDFGYDGIPDDRYFASLETSWDMLRGITLSLPVLWESGQQAAFAAVSYEQYSAGLSLGRGLTRKLSASAYYRWTTETSNRSQLNYTDNIVGLNLTWQF